MALSITVDDVELVYLGITSSGTGVDLELELTADWLPVDSLGLPINMIGQQKDSEGKLFSLYPQEVRDAVVTLRDYAEARIKAAKGI